jgi:acyl-coenzyme A synthetase/AMP-(fatty) acid ligase
MNIADIIDEHARQRPDAPALLREDWTLSYAGLQAAVRRAAAMLADQGLRPSEVVGVSIAANPALLLVCLLALARLGAVSVPIHPTTKRAKRRAIARHIGLCAFIANRDQLGVEGTRLMRPDESWLQPAGRALARPPAHPGGDHPWSITLTSGTTGTPKGIQRTHAGFIALSRLQRAHAPLPPDSRFFCRMDPHNTAVIMRGLNHLVEGGAVVFAPVDLASAFHAIDRHRVTDMFASPAMMVEWVNALAPGRRHFKTPIRVVVGGARLADTLAQAVTERITPNLWLSYGTTETGVVAMADAATSGRYPATAGRLVPWVEAQIVDERDQPLAAGEVGTLRFRGEGVARGYYGEPAAPSDGAKGFRHGWFYPGDIGYITPDRLLFIEERSDDVLNLGGPRVNAGEVERILALHPDVREVAVFTTAAPGGATRLVAAVVARGALNAPALRRHYTARGGRFGDWLRIARLKELPRNSMGKVVKAELRRRLRFKAAA